MSFSDDRPSVSEEDLFHAAAELPAAERPAFLLARCEGESALRARLEGLLASHEEREFMQRSADRVQSSEFEGELARFKPEADGDRIGRYRLLEQIGEGGFGVVWRAAQLEPVRREVALKIIKAGMDSKEVIARFELERQEIGRASCRERV